MGATTFTGPIKAGNILNTSGSTLGTDVANVGYVVMAQSSAVTQAATTTSIVIPANSQILSHRHHGYDRLDGRSHDVWRGYDGFGDVPDGRWRA